MLEEFEKELDTCTACPKMCSFSCPVSAVEKNEMTTPWGKMQAANLVRKGVLPLSEEIVELAYKCTSCRLCTEYCTHGVDVATVLTAFRKEAVDRHLAPKEILGFLEKFHHHNNPFGRDLHATLESLIPDKYRNSRADTVYFVGCATIAQTPEVISDTFSLFDKLGVEGVTVYLDPIQCCGYPLHAGGVEEEFEDIAEFQFQSLKRYRHIVSTSPTCIYTFKEIYKKFHFDFHSRLMTMSEFLAPYFKKANYMLNKTPAKNFIYHDPCYLGRYLGEYDTPRELIKLATEVAPFEFAAHRAESVCCGQGGCYSITSPQFSNEVSANRLAELKEKNIDTLITHCPGCTQKFRKTLEGIQVTDLMSFLNKAIESHE